jgi:hypothetical protein
MEEVQGTQHPPLRVTTPSAAPSQYRDIRGNT